MVIWKEHQLIYLILKENSIQLMIKFCAHHFIRAIGKTYEVLTLIRCFHLQVDRHGSYINGYHVGYFPAGDSSKEKIITVIGSRSLVLTGLEPWSRYTIVVRPFHGLYRGDESEPFAGQTAEDSK